MGKFLYKLSKIKITWDSLTTRAARRQRIIPSKSEGELCLT